jgi:hypothetical protein
MTTPQDFQPVFQGLRAILQPYAPYLTLKHDSHELYSLDGPYSPKFKQDLFFGSAHIKKNYVSFYLMPVYMFPDLLEDISPGLKKRMQGKSCFNFKTVDNGLFVELAELTKRAYERFKQETA